MPTAVNAGCTSGGQAVYDQADQPLPLAGTILDITANRRAEEKLGLSKRGAIASPSIRVEN
jgi:hypothetical protein